MNLSKCPKSVTSTNMSTSILEKFNVSIINMKNLELGKEINKIRRRSHNYRYVENR